MTASGDQEKTVSLGSDTETEENDGSDSDSGNASESSSNQSDKESGESIHESLSNDEQNHETSTDGNEYFEAESNDEKHTTPENSTKDDQKVRTPEDKNERFIVEEEDTGTLGDDEKIQHKRQKSAGVGNESEVNKEKSSEASEESKQVQDKVTLCKNDKNGNELIESEREQESKKKETKAAATKIKTKTKTKHKKDLEDNHKKVHQTTDTQKHTKNHDRKHEIQKTNASTTASLKQENHAEHHHEKEKSKAKENGVHEKASHEKNYQKVSKKKVLIAVQSNGFAESHHHEKRTEGDNSRKEKSVSKKSAKDSSDGAQVEKNQHKKIHVKQNKKNASETTPNDREHKVHKHHNEAKSKIKSDAYTDDSKVHRSKGSSSKNKLSHSNKQDIEMNALNEKPMSKHGNRSKKYTYQNANQSEDTDYFKRTAEEQRLKDQQAIEEMIQSMKKCTNGGLSLFCCCFQKSLNSNAKRLLYYFTHSIVIYFMIIQVVMFLFVELPIEKGVKNTIDNPLLGVFKKTFLKLGARETYRIQNFEIYRLFTPLFLSVGFVPLIFDLLFLGYMCTVLERKWGRIQFWFIFVFSGVGAQLLNSISRPETINVGPACALVGVAFGGLIDLLLSLEKKREKVKTGILCSIYTFCSFMTSLAPFVEALTLFFGAVIGITTKLLFTLNLKYLTPPVKILIMVLVYIAICGGFTFGFVYLFCGPEYRDNFYFYDI